MKSIKKGKCIQHNLDDKRSTGHEKQIYIYTQNILNN